jgi:hypothetical protein
MSCGLRSTVYSLQSTVYGNSFPLFAIPHKDNIFIVSQALRFSMHDSF